MMKNLLYIALFLIATSCYGAGYKIEVRNSLPFDRANETVEISWGDVLSGVAHATPQNIVVLDTNGKQLASQVIYNGRTKPQSLIFQATVAAKSHNEYLLDTGTRQEYPTQAFGRYVPERKDDYAWENNMAAYRLYGPALTDPVAPGIDVWVKRTHNLVIDKWYKIGDYHHDMGEGMDCYKVGATLGGGASAPYVDGKLWLSANYARQERLDNGPIRTTVRLTYAPFKVGERSVALVKTISLDANTPFSKMSNLYSGEFTKLPIAAGVVMHDVKDKFFGKKYIAITEAASDSKTPEADGNISLAVIMPCATSALEAQGHALVIGQAENDKPLVYWSGAGWSKSWVKDAEAWKEFVKNETKKLSSPLKVVFSK